MTKKTASMLVLGLSALGLSGTAAAATPLMSPAWAAEACNAWNHDPVLTSKLVESGWIKNDKGRGYKILEVYRADCEDSPKVEFKVQDRNGKAICTYGGVASIRPDYSVDYAMWADTDRWEEMGKGDYGPMKAMMFGRLKFQGPKMEAMRNMAPFTNFLLLVGKVPGDTNTCPK